MSLPISERDDLDLHNAAEFLHNEYQMRKAAGSDVSNVVNAYPTALSEQSADRQVAGPARPSAGPANVAVIAMGSALEVPTSPVDHHPASVSTRYEIVSRRILRSRSHLCIPSLGIPTRTPGFTLRHRVFDARASTVGYRETPTVANAWFSRMRSASDLDLSGNPIPMGISNAVSSQQPMHVTSQNPSVRR